MAMTDIPTLDVGEAYAFACRLRGDPAEMNDSSRGGESFTPSWPVKVYEGGERVSLAGAVPWWMPAPAAQSSEPAQRLGDLLFHAVGISRVRWQSGGMLLSSPQHPGSVWPEARLGVRRPVPSGGAMYPTEVYVAAMEGLGGPAIFHYDPARHELTNLAHPSPAEALRAALGLSAGAPLAPLSLILSHRFCKNLYKYANFAYRLGAVDLGVVLGRLLASATRAFGVAGVRVDFDDAALHELCGIDAREEGAYAVLMLGRPQPVPSPARQGTPGVPSRPRVLERGRPAQPSPSFAAMHAAACLTPPGRQDLAPQYAREELAAGSAPSSGAVRLPELTREVDVPRRALLRRTSNGTCFTGAPLGANVLAIVLHRTHEAVASLRAACRQARSPEVRLYCAVERVEGISPGWYRYEPSTHSLVPTGAGQQGSTSAVLQQTLHAATVDVERSSFSLHIATVIDFRTDPRGVRAYRVQQLFVGAAIEAATRWSAVAGAGSHPLLGFDAHRIDRLYGLEGSPLGVQAHVPIGAVRPSGILEGSVIS